MKDTKDGRCNLTRKVRTPGLSGPKEQNKQQQKINIQLLLGDYFPGNRLLTAGKIRVVYTSPSGMRGSDGANAALRNAAGLAGEKTPVVETD